MANKILWVQVYHKSSSNYDFGINDEVRVKYTSGAIKTYTGKFYNLPDTIKNFCTKCQNTSTQLVYTNSYGFGVLITYKSDLC